MYWRNKYGSDNGNKEDDEKALIQQDSANKNNNCSNNGQRKKFKGKCNNCGKVGHKAVDCWADPKNASKRPAWFKPSEVAAASATEKRSSSELQLINMSWGKYAEAFAEDDDNYDYEANATKAENNAEAHIC